MRATDVDDAIVNANFTLNTHCEHGGEGPAFTVKTFAATVPFQLGFLWPNRKRGLLLAHPFANPTTSIRTVQI